MTDMSVNDRAAGGKWAFLWEWSQLVGAILLVSASLVWLTFSPAGHGKTSDSMKQGEKGRTVDVVDSNTIRIIADSPLGKRLEQFEVASTNTTSPILQVTGRVIACRRPAEESNQASFWQFSSGELLDSFTAWQKAKLEASFAATQLGQVKELAAAREDALTHSIERLEKLVRSGTETEKALAAERTLLLQTRIEDRKAIFDAEVALKSGERQTNSQLLQLQQYGLDPGLLDDAPTDLDLVSAEVPESMVSQVAIGQQCSAEFFGMPRQLFDGKVSTLSPVLNAEQRTLRVLFLVKDPDDLLRPGMFAKVGVGTDPREVIRVPSDSILHIAACDIVLIAKPRTEGEEWLELSIQKVEVQEQVNSLVEVRSGLSPGQILISKNAILMKPLVTQAFKLGTIE